MKPSCFVTEKDYKLWKDADKQGESDRISNGTYKVNICKDCNEGLIPDLQQKMTRLGLCDHPYRWAGSQKEFIKLNPSCDHCGKTFPLSRFRGDDGFYMRVCRNCYEEATSWVQVKRVFEEEDPDGYKKCTKCNVSRPLSDYYFTTLRSGLKVRRADCQFCVRKKRRETYHKKISANDQ